jgi:hypothetical protein
VVSAIAEALAAGEIGLAAEVLWAGLKVVWREGVVALNKVWQGAKRFFVQAAVDMWYGALTAAEDVGHLMMVAWVETTSFLSRTWERFTSFLTDTWNTVGYLLTRSWNEIKGIFDDTFDVAEANLKAASDLIDKLEKTDAARAARLDELEARRKQQREDEDAAHERRLLELAQAWVEAEQNINDAAAEGVKKAKEELEAAKKALAEAIAKVKGLKDAQDKEPPGQPSREAAGKAGAGKPGLAGVGVGKETRGGAEGAFNVLNLVGKFANVPAALRQAEQRTGRGLAQRSGQQVTTASKRLKAEDQREAIKKSTAATAKDIAKVKEILINLGNQIGTA